jgi:hypothetical protein
MGGLRDGKKENGRSDPAIFLSAPAIAGFRHRRDPLELDRS